MNRNTLVANSRKTRNAVNEALIIVGRGHNLLDTSACSDSVKDTSQITLALPWLQKLAVNGSVIMKLLFKGNKQGIVSRLHG